MADHKRSIGFGQSIYIQSVRQGMTLAIPFLLLGSSALLLRNLPVPAWKGFLNVFFDGGFSAVLLILYQISLGSLALVLCLSISLAFGRLTGLNDYYLYPLVSLTSYLAFCGGISGQDSNIFSSEWGFTAMCITLLSCALFRHGSQLARRLEKLHTIGAEYLFNITILNLFPCVIIMILFTSAGHLLRSLWDNGNITNFGSSLFLTLFQSVRGNLSGTLLYVLLLHTLWFFGIHGANTLGPVTRELFEHQVSISIFSKSFLDTFVFLGGCGCALSLVIALCLCARKSHNRKLALIALPFTLFNISEIIIFGFSIILNPVMLIPFILAPIMNTLTSTLAITGGLVPMVSHTAAWTTPVIFSGYHATGSVSGSVLQLVNISLGVLIYIPFVQYSERQQTREFSQAIRHIVNDQKTGEISCITPQLIHHSYPYSNYARTLSMDLQNAMRRDKVELYYQPQISSSNRLHGIEALLRWEHPIVGFVPPPLVISLASENDFLDELTFILLQKACKDGGLIAQTSGTPFYLSFNITPKQLEHPGFGEQLINILESYPGREFQLTLEVTENAVLETSEHVTESLNMLLSHGIEFSVDDFGMGHSSMMHLLENNFHEVKLDGNLVTQITSNERSREIIAGILYMSDALHYRVIAEFVETQKQRDTLESLGCTIYQGYYYSKPLALDGLLEFCKSFGKIGK